MIGVGIYKRILETGKMTLREAYEYGQKQLKIAAITEAEIDAWYLLEYATGITRAEYFLDMNREISIEDETQYRKYIERRGMRVPLQHITGVQEFMGFEFAVNEHVLVPRQDTEVLVETVLEQLKGEETVLDMCTGSGCILISLLKLGRQVCGTGADISKEALKIARQNANNLKVTAEFMRSNLFEKIKGKYDVIVSNPPYIPTAIIEGLQEEVKLHDPFIALDGKEDGLFFYRKIIEESVYYLQPGGKLYFEIGHDQGESVSDLMKTAGFTDVTVKKDLAGLDRVVCGVYI